MSMRIVVAGTWRSGTTPLYNLIRIICESNGKTYACFEDGYDYEKARVSKFQIVKCHKFNEDWLDWCDNIPSIDFRISEQIEEFYTPQKLVFTTHRGSEDIKGSMDRFKKTGGTGNAANVENLMRGLEHWGLWQKYACYTAIFWRLKRSPNMLARHIAAILNIPINEKEIGRKFNAIKPPKKGIDPVTLLHSNHITQK